MNLTDARWMHGDYFLFDGVAFDPATELLQVRFRNGDIAELRAVDLWQDRPGRPDWQSVRVDLDTRGAILVSTVAGHPSLEGDIAEFPGDVFRMATDAEYRAYVWGLAIGESGRRTAVEGGLAAPPG